MSTIISSISPIWKVLLVGLVLGAGLPALFAFGVRGSAGTVGPDGAVTPPSAASRVSAAVCFAIVGVVIIAALILLAASKTFLARFGLS